MTAKISQSLKEILLFSPTLIEELGWKRWPYVALAEAELSGCNQAVRTDILERLGSQCLNLQSSRFGCEDSFSIQDCNIKSCLFLTPRWTETNPLTFQMC